MVKIYRARLACAVLWVCSACRQWFRRVPVNWGRRMGLIKAGFIRVNFHEVFLVEFL